MRFPLLAAVVLLLGLQTAPADTTDTEDALASGQGVTVTPRDLRLELQLLSPAQRRQVLEERAELQNTLTRLYFRRRMAMLAEELGYLDEEPTRARLQQVREQLLAELVPRRYVDELELPDFTDEARAYYEANLDEFTPPEQIRAAHILLKAPSEADRERRRPEAEALLAQLQQGADFGELAHEHSEDGSRFMNGDLGFFGPGEMVPEFDQAAFALTEPGEITDVVETRFGLHIIKLYERPSTDPLPFAQVEDRIRERLRREYRQEQLAAWLQSVASPAAAQVDEQALEATWSALRDEFRVDSEGADQ